MPTAESSGATALRVRRPSWRTVAALGDQLAHPFQRHAALPGRRELLIALAACLVASLAMYGPHVIRGGWYMDDWILIAQAELASGPFAALDQLLSQGYRPVFSFTIWALYMIGGTGQSSYLAIGVGLITLQVLALYTALRVIGVVIVPAAIIALLHLVLPTIDAARLWITAYPLTLAVLLYLVGLSLAIAGLRGPTRRRRIAMHAGALLLFALAMLSYELVSPLVVLSALLYLLHAGRARVAKRWAADVVVVAAVIGWMASNPEQNRVAVLTVGYVRDRIEEVLVNARFVFAETFPFDEVLWGPLGVVLVFFAAVGLGVAWGGGGAAARTATSWAVMGGLGLLFALAGLSFLVPAEPYYVPRPSGLGNRLTIIASVGEVVLIVALTVLVALGLLVLARRPRWLGPVALVALLAWTGSLVRQEVRNQGVWADSWQLSQSVVAAVRRTVRDPAPGSGIVAFNHVRNLLPADVPVFYSTWDLNGAVRLTYRDASITGQSANPETACLANGVRLPGAPAVGSQPAGVTPYGKTYFVDTVTYEGFPVPSRARCTDLLARLGPE